MRARKTELFCVALIVVIGDRAPDAGSLPQLKLLPPAQRRLHLSRGEQGLRRGFPLSLPRPSRDGMQPRAWTW